MPVQRFFRFRSPATAAARSHGSAAEAGAASAIGRIAPGALTAILLAAHAAPTAAQVTASAGIDSDYRFRGYSLSKGDPALTLNLGYDHASGVYLNGATAFSVDGSDPTVIGYQANAGYAAEVGPGLSVDAGIVRSWYTRQSATGRDTHYTEAYLGVAGRGLSSRVYFSPDYLRPGTKTLYAEIEGMVGLAPEWHLAGHAGVLTHLDERPWYARREHYDWRLTLARELGKVDLHLSVSGGRPGRDYYSGRRHSPTALVAGASLSF